MFGITGEKLGLWDYTLFEIGITEIRSEIALSRVHHLGFHTKPIWKLGLRDSIPFEIGITGLHPI